MVRESIELIGRILDGQERVEVQATGVVEGDVTAPKLIVAEGAVLNGNIHMSKPSGAAGAQPPTPEARKTA